MSIIKKALKKILPKRMVVAWQRRKFLKGTLLEKKVSYGSMHPDKTFFVIRRDHGCGLFSDFNYVLGHIMYAEEKGWIPVVDMQNYPNYYKEEEPINGTMNAWEYYFEQPAGYSLEDIAQARNVVLSQGYPFHDRFDYGLTYIAKLDRSEIYRVNEYINRYIKLKPDVTEKVEQFHKEFFKNAKTLGAVYRGTDYQALKPQGHHVQPSLEQVIQKIEEMQKQWSCDKVFFMSEEKEAVDKVTEYFGMTGGGGVIIYQKQRIEGYDGTTWTPAWKFDRENYKYYSGLEYLIEVLLLSKCDYLIGGTVGAVGAAISINGLSYQDQYVFDLGKF